MSDLKYYCDDSGHLVCVPFSVDNLHVMAKELGIKRCWYHNAKTHPHYDIPKRRYAEIRAKCTAIGGRDILAIIRGATPK